MSDKQQFDVSLGGEEKLPRDAAIKSLATARANEMAAMTYNLGKIFFFNKQFMYENFNISLTLLSQNIRIKLNSFSKNSRCTCDVV